MRRSLDQADCSKACWASLSSPRLKRSACANARRTPSAMRCWNGRRTCSHAAIRSLRIRLTRARTQVCPHTCSFSLRRSLVRFSHFSIISTTRSMEEAQLPIAQSRYGQPQGNCSARCVTGSDRAAISGISPEWLTLMQSQLGTTVAALKRLHAITSTERRVWEESARYSWGAQSLSIDF